MCVCLYCVCVCTYVVYVHDCIVWGGGKHVGGGCTVALGGGENGVFVCGCVCVHMCVCV